MNTALIRPEWSPLTIALMVLGFIIFWPLGLAVLAYILWGEYLGGSKDRAERWFDDQKRHFKTKHGGNSAWRSGRTGNAAFDDYRDEQLKRLEEERQRLEDERAAFEEYLANLHKARDREEFDRFMRDRGGQRDTSRPEDGPSYSG